MFLKNKSFARFSVLSLLTIVFSLLIFGVLLEENVTERITEAHLRAIPETVRTSLDQHPEAASWFLQQPGGTLPEPVARLSESLHNIPGVFRVKVWSANGTILWSDKPELIGKNFAQNPHFQIASNGNVAFNNEGFRKVESFTEENERVVVEVYLPVRDGNRVVGVLELYESDMVLSAQLLDSSKFIWTLIVASGFALYLLTLAVFMLSRDITSQPYQKD